MRDDGTVQTLEATLVAIILVAAVSFVVTFSAPTTTTEPARVALESGVDDALGLLYETPANAPGYGNNWLSRAIAHCMQDNCDELQEKVESLLPAGTQFNVWLSNGYQDYPVYVRDLPRGETAVSTRHIEPKWSFTFLSTDYNLTDSEGGEPLVIYALPVQYSNVVTDGGIPIQVVVNGTRNDGTNISYTAATSTYQVSPSSATLASSVSATFRDWAGGAAGYLNVTNVTVTNGTGALTDSPVPIRIHVTNGAGAKSVAAGSKIRVDVPRDWAAAARQIENPDWKVLQNASDHNGTHTGSYVEAEILSDLVAGDSTDFLIQATLKGSTKDYYTFSASFGDSAFSRAELVVRGNSKLVPSTVDYPFLAFSAPKPMGATQNHTWALALSAPLLDTTGLDLGANVTATELQEVRFSITSVEVYSPDGYDVFDGDTIAAIKNTADGYWKKDGKKLVWAGNGSASRDDAFEITWAVQGNGVATPTATRPPNVIPLSFDGYTGRIMHEVEPGLFWGEVWPENGTRPGYEILPVGLSLAETNPFSTNFQPRKVPLRGFDNYSVSAAPNLRDAGAGGRVWTDARNVPIGTSVTMRAEAESLLLRLSELGSETTASLRLYPPWSVDSKVPAWENSSLETRLLQNDVRAIVVRDTNADGIDDVVVGTSDGRLLALDGRSGERVPNLYFQASGVGNTATAITTLERATLDGKDVIIVGTDAAGAYVHAVDFLFTEQYRWTKDTLEAVVALDATTDMDGDGITDVIVAQSGNVTVLSGKSYPDGIFREIAPPDRPGSSVFHNPPSTPSGIAGLDAFGSAGGPGFAVAMPDIIGAITLEDLVVLDPSALTQLELSPSVPVPQVGAEGVNHRGSLAWSLYNVPATTLAETDVDGDGASDLIAGAASGLVMALNGTQGTPPLHTVTYSSAGRIAGSYAMDANHVYLITSTGAVFYTDDAFVTTYCLCDPVTGAVVPLTGARNVTFNDATDELWAVGALATTWTGSVDPTTRLLTFTPKVWGVDLTATKCAWLSGCSWNAYVPTENFNDVHFKPDGTGFIVGSKCALTCDDSLVMKSNIAGTAWTVLSSADKSPSPTGTAKIQTATGTAVTAELRKVNFTTNTLGWILGDSGTILRTTDGGSHWQGLELPAAISTSTIMDVSCVPNGADHACWIVANNTSTGATRLYYAANAGTTTSAADWTEVATGSSRTIRSVGFVDSSVGYVGGKETILATYDGGTSWTRLPTTAVSESREIATWPDGTAYVMGGDVTNAHVHVAHDYRTGSRAESTDILEGCGCAIVNVSVDVDASYVANGTDVGGTWATYWGSVDGGSTWKRFERTGVHQLRGLEGYDPIDFSADAGSEFRWRADLNVTPDMTAFSPQVRSITFHVNYTVGGGPAEYRHLTESFTNASWKASTTDAEWNTSLGTLRAPRIHEFWVRNVNGTVESLRLADVTGDGVAEIVVGTGKIYAINDPLYMQLMGAAPDQAISSDNRVHVLGAGGTPLWSSEKLTGPVVTVAVADLEQPAGSPDAYLDVVATTWNATTGEGEIVAFAGADGSVIWRTALLKESVQLEIAENPSDPTKPMPVAATLGPAPEKSGYAWAYDYADGALLWRGIPDENGAYAVTLDIPMAMPFGPYVVEFELEWEKEVSGTVSGSPATTTVLQSSRFYTYFNVVPPPPDPMPVSPIYTVKVVAWRGEWDYATVGNTAGDSGNDGDTSGPDHGGNNGNSNSGYSPSYKDCLMNLCVLEGGNGWSMSNVG